MAFPLIPVVAGVGFVWGLWKLFARGGSAPEDDKPPVDPYKPPVDPVEPEPDVMAKPTDAYVLNQAYNAGDAAGREDKHNGRPSRGGMDFADTGMMAPSYASAALRNAMLTRYVAGYNAGYAAETSAVIVPSESQDLKAAKRGSADGSYNRANGIDRDASDAYDLTDLGGGYPSYKAAYNAAYEV